MDYGYRRAPALATRFREADFQIPLPPLEVQQEIVAEIEGYQKVIDGARAVVENYRPHIHVDPDWPMVRVDGDRGVNFPSDTTSDGYCVFLRHKEKSIGLMVSTLKM